MEGKSWKFAVIAFPLVSSSVTLVRKMSFFSRPASSRNPEGSCAYPFEVAIYKLTALVYRETLLKHERVSRVFIYDRISALNGFVKQF